MRCIASRQLGRALLFARGLFILEFRSGLARRKQIRGQGRLLSFEEWPALSFRAVSRPLWLVRCGPKGLLLCCTTLLSTGHHQRSFEDWN